MEAVGWFARTIRGWALNVIAVVTAMSVSLTAQAAIITVQGTNSFGPVNCIPFGCPSIFDPHMGFVYKNVPAFTLNPGDILSYDLGRANDLPLSFTISLAATVIPPFLKRRDSRAYAAKANFCLGVIPPIAMLGRS